MKRSTSQPLVSPASLRGIIKGRDQAGLLVEFPVIKCTSCKKTCGLTGVQLVQLPLKSGLRPSATRVEVSLNGASHVWLQFISLMIPLVGFMVGAALGDQLLLTDFECVVFSLGGMALGSLICKLASSVLYEENLIKRLTIKEV